ncbi:MAG: gfo/Idh/MocA family oxidoreductase, partial [Candidatus Nanopelagicales bacterium]
MSDVRVGLLAYGAIGDEHNRAVQATPGLTLGAVCDVNPERIAAARSLAPEVAGFDDANAMLDS